MVAILYRRRYIPFSQRRVVEGPDFGTDTETTGFN